MIFPYSFKPWLIRKIIKSGTSVQKIIMRPEQVYHVSDQWITLSHYGSDIRFPLRIRAYMPKGEGPFPIVVFFHGGGWVICDLDTHDEVCRHISIKANCVVVSVDYRLAPEYKFPVPVEDAYSAATYICEHATSFKGDPSRVCLSGDSAGGNLSIVCSQLAKQRNGPSFYCLATVYPSVDLRDACDCNYDSYGGKNVGMNKEDSDWFLRHYFRMHEDKWDPRASPIVTQDLSNLPPILIVTGEHDRIRDPAETYGIRLQAAGVRVTMKRYPEVGHGFLAIGAPDVAKQALDLMAKWIVNTFNGIPVPNTLPTSLLPIFDTTNTVPNTIMSPSPQIPPLSATLSEGAELSPPVQQISTPDISNSSSLNSPSLSPSISTPNTPNPQTNEQQIPTYQSLPSPSNQPTSTLHPT